MLNFLDIKLFDSNQLAEDVFPRRAVAVLNRRVWKLAYIGKLENV